MHEYAVSNDINYLIRFTEINKQLKICECTLSKTQDIKHTNAFKWPAGYAKRIIKRDTPDIGYSISIFDTLYATLDTGVTCMQSDHYDVSTTIRDELFDELVDDTVEDKELATMLEESGF